MNWSRFRSSSRARRPRVQRAVSLALCSATLAIAGLSATTLAVVTHRLQPSVVAHATSPPTVSALAPESAPTTGGTTITITGTNFSTTAGATTVSFGSVPSPTPPNVTSTTSLTVVAPAEAPGEMYVTVTTTSGGTSGTGTSSAFLFVSAGPYTPLSSPVRICDTRANQNNQCDNYGSTDRAIAANGTLTVQVGAYASDGVPLNAAAAVVNVTALAGAHSGYFAVYPSGLATPTAGSNENFNAGAAVANLVEVPLGQGPIGTQGAIKIFNGSSGSTDVPVDLLGYVPGTPTTATSGLFNALAPAQRICDTRSGNSTQCNGLGAVAAGSSLTINAENVGGIPSSGVQAVVLNVTALPTGSGGGGVVVFCGGCATPSTSTLNLFPSTQAVSNRVIVPVGTGANAGKVTILVWVPQHISSSMQVRGQPMAAARLRPGPT